MESLYNTLLLENVLEIKSASQSIQDYYVSHIKDLDPHHKQHFVTRMSLITKKLWMHMKPCLRGVISDAQNVARLIENEKWDDIIDEYVCEPYKQSTKKSMFNYLKKIENPELKEYLCYGHLMALLHILERNCQPDFTDKDMLESINNIFQLINTDKLLDMHEKAMRDPEWDIKQTSGTLFINFIGCMMNLTGLKKSDLAKTRISQYWKESRSYYLTLKYNKVSLYAATHIIINATNFYKDKLDVIEYRQEIDYISQWLRQVVSSEAKKISNDLLIEAALCQKMADNPVLGEWRIVMDTMSVNKKTHIIQSNNDQIDDEKANLNANEHTNILFILLQKQKT